MHIPENVQITIPVKSTTANSFDRTDSEMGVVLVSAADASEDSQSTTASKANDVDQQILGAVGGEGDIAKVKGEIVMQVSAAFTDAQMQAGYIATVAPGANDVNVGKVGAGDAAGFAAGTDLKGIITRYGNDATIGHWIAIIL